MRICNRCFLLLLAGSVTSASPVVDVDVDWPSFLARSDPTWAIPPEKWYESGFVGNGALGAMVTVDSSSDALQLTLGSSAVWDDRPPGASYSVQPDNFVCNRPRLPLGKFVLDGVDIDPASFHMRLKLWDGELIGSSGVNGLSWRVFAHAVYTQADVIAVELTHNRSTSSGTKLPMPTWRWQPAVAESTWKSKCPGYVDSPPISNATMASDGAELWTQRHLKGTEHATAFLAVQSPALATAAAIAPTTTVLYISTSAVMAAGDGAAAALAAVRAAAALGIDSLTDSHRSWWHGYYPRSFVTLSEPMIESFYWVQMYKVASATRADRQVYDLMGPWYVDGTSWPDLHWDLNLQLTYWPMFTSNRLDLVGSLTALLQRNTRNLVNNVPPAWRADSAAAPSGASSLDLHETCYWDHGDAYNGTCLTTPPTVTGNLLWVLQLWHNLYRYRGYDAEELGRLFPLLARAVTFYSHTSYSDGPANGGRGASGDGESLGALHLNATLSPEYAAAVDCNYDVALLRWGLGAVLDAADSGRLPVAQADPRLSIWRDMAARLVPYPTDNATGFLIGKDMPLAHGHRHFSHLMMLFPLKALALPPGGAGPDAEVARRSLDHWLGLTSGLTGFCRTAASSMNVLLGRRAAARTNLTYLLNDWILPNTMYHEGENGACGETPPAAASAVMDWMVMEWNGVVRVFAGIDDAQTRDAAFAGLLAPGGFEIAARRAGNVTQFVTITNAARVSPDDVPSFSLLVDAMPLPWAAAPPGVKYAARADDSGIVDVDMSTVPANATVAFWSAAAPEPPVLQVAPSTGGSTDEYNWWGLPKGPPPAPTPVPPPAPPQRPCSQYGAAPPPGWVCRAGYCSSDEPGAHTPPDCGAHSLAEPTLGAAGCDGSAASLSKCAAAAAAACEATAGCGAFSLDPDWGTKAKLWRNNGTALVPNAGWNTWTRL